MYMHKIYKAVFQEIKQVKMNANIFGSVEYLEPRCPGCDVILDYGVNTEYDEERHSHRCLNCGCSL
jgi:hypothetical protein